ALKAAGYAPASIIVRPGGEVAITPGPAPGGATAQARPGPALTDGLTPADPAAKPADLDGWRERKKARGDRAA
ncbi:hypothetical protein L6232_22850, partial [Shewanella sp. C31]|nr:hypothetical protein [Shewanella electrica]